MENLTRQRKYQGGQELYEHPVVFSVVIMFQCTQNLVTFVYEHLFDLGNLMDPL